MTTRFKKAGKVERVKDALKIEITGYYGGEPYVAAADVPRLIAGEVVDIALVKRTFNEVVHIGKAGKAWITKSGRGITFKIAGKSYLSPRYEVEDVVTGRVQAARLSKIVEEDDLRRGLQTTFNDPRMIYA